MQIQDGKSGSDHDVFIRDVSVISSVFAQRLKLCRRMDTYFVHCTSFDGEYHTLLVQGNDIPIDGLVECRKGVGQRLEFDVDMRSL